MSSGSGPVGFIGLGIMGLPMAQNIVTKTDRDLVVWNRSAERSKILADGYAGKIKVRIRRSFSVALRSYLLFYCWLIR